MELWNEYEGRTIDGIFPLAKLLQPEGRSAFFSTPNGTGTPTVIRLIESHFDDEEILARWRGVVALNNPNLVTLKKFGKAELDGTQLVYVVIEPAEANLGEIVSERRLTVPETTQIAASLVAALDALHTHGFIHEHVEPGNVLAVGEEIKLRSDCIREAPEGAEGRELKQRDVHDLAIVLLRALTQQRTLADAASDLPLPTPFEEIVHNGISGEWGLPEIAAALTPAPNPQATRATKPVVPPSVQQPVAPTSAPPPARALVQDEKPTGRRPILMVALAISVLVLVVIAWNIFHRPAPQSNATPEAAAPAAAATESTPAATKPDAPVNPPPVVAKSSARVNTPPAASSTATAPSPAASTATGGRTLWRVIAFTYNHEDAAKAKAARIAEQHPELKPDVFTPNGQSPYLVVIGGTMTRDEAFALAQKARSEGLPPELYAQNYRH